MRRIPLLPATKRRQSGVALLMVLVIVAIATVLTVGMISNQSQVTRRAGSLFAQDQSRLYVLGAEDFVKELINTDTQQKAKASNPRDTLADIWAQPFPSFPVPGGTVSAKLIDAQSRFNVNDLVQNGAVNEAAVNFFQHLLLNLGQSESLVYALEDWEDADSQPVNSDGAEDDYYSRMNPPYRAANGPLASISELALIRGYTPDVIKALTPYVCALPVFTPMNVNTMSSMLMSSLTEGLAASAGDEIVQRRPTDGYKTVDDLLSESEFNSISSQQRTDLHGLLDVRTNFFQMTADATIDDRHTHLVSVIQRGNSDTLAVISRNYGHRFEPDTTSPNAAAASGTLQIPTNVSGS